MKKKYQVKEIFGPTIQGEAHNTGAPCMFVRLSRCNRWTGKAEDKPASICNYCDTDFVGGEMMSPDDILKAIVRHGMRAVVLTGGEPMLQLRDGALTAFLARYGIKVMIETNGSIDAGRNVKADITISPKQSASKTFVPRGSTLKFLYPWISPEVTPEKFLQLFIVDRVYIQPIDRPGEDHTKAAFDEVVSLHKAGVNAFLSQQTHKQGGFE